MFRLEPRPTPAAWRRWASPLWAALITLIVGAALLQLTGHDPARGLWVFLIEPLSSLYALSELALKATPLVLIALGLAACFRAQVWNLGAEGQFIAGAVAASGMALQAQPHTGSWMVAAVLLAGMAGGMVWAGGVAWLRDRFNASEVLVSLMLVYVAEHMLSYLVNGPWKDPAGFGFPQTFVFLDSARVPVLVAGWRVHLGTVLALLVVGIFWLAQQRSYFGFQLQVEGLAPEAARYAGFSSRRALWSTLLLSGGMAGLAGALEVAGPLGQLTPYVPAGYGFAAIVVAYVGRLHPAGIVLAALLISVFGIGGELAQARLGWPKAFSTLLQGLLLGVLLVCDACASHQVRWQRPLGMTRSAAGST
jgi:general nucleoside transport system permease protein